MIIGIIKCRRGSYKRGENSNSRRICRRRLIVHAMHFLRMAAIRGGVMPTIIRVASWLIFSFAMFSRLWHITRLIVLETRHVHANEYMIKDYDGIIIYIGLVQRNERPVATLDTAHRY